VKWARRTNVAARVLCAIGLALAGRAGARLAGRLGVPASRATLLRLVRRLPDPAPAVLTRIGVDDFAFRRGHTYGTVIVNIDTHAHPSRCRARVPGPGRRLRRGRPHRRPERDAGRRPMASMAQPPPGRREDCYRRTRRIAGARTGPATGVQGSCGQAGFVSGRATDDAAGGAAGDPDPARYAAVQRLVAAGRSISAIGKELGLQRKTLRRFAFADSLDELLTTATTRGSLLDPFKPYLHQRFNAGHTDAARLTREITALGYRGSDKTVRRYLQPFRETLAATSPAPVPPSVRQVTGWLTCHPDRLTDDDRVQLKQVLARSDMLTITHQQVHDFAELLTQRRGEHLHGWMCDVDARGAAPLRSFTKGLRTDLAAVAAGLTIPYSSGPGEGAITHPQRAAARPVAIRHRTFPIWALHVGAPHN
jgi:hypothetical protein